ECIYTMIDILNEPSITSDFLKEQISHLYTEKNLILVEDKVYLPSLYYAEDHFSSHIKRIMKHQLDIDVVEAELMKTIGEIDENEKIECMIDDVNQVEAIKQTLHTIVMILTERAGTVKKNVNKGIVDDYGAIHDKSLRIHDYDKKKYFPLLLIATTGRAAKLL